MKSFLNIDTWARKDHFFFFKEFNEPFFGITTEVDCSVGYRNAKKENISFFLYYLYQSLKAVNTIEEFRYRIEGDQIAVYDSISASSTVPRPNGTFGFSYIPFNENFEDFYSLASAEIERVANSSGLEPSGNNQNVVHYSTLPWINFTALSHARHYAIADSVPKISFGMLHDKDRKKVMSMSIHVNHAVMDGYHVAKYIELFQKLMNTKR